MPDSASTRRDASTASQELTRRAFLSSGSLVLAGGLLSAQRSLAGQVSKESPAEEPVLRIGLITDLHYADKAPSGARHYRQSIPKLRDAVAEFRRKKPALVVELGDLIDAAPDVETEIAYLKTIERELDALPCDRHYVLGNHCVSTLKKEEFFENSKATSPHYAFDAGETHCVVLDACFRKDLTPYGRNNFAWNDSNVPPKQLAWLKNDLSKTKKKTLLFVHQRLDVPPPYGVGNAAAVRKVLEDAGNVVAVFQGHNHVNDHREINGIHYVAVNAMVDGGEKESSAYALLDVYKDSSLRVTGFRRQKSYRKLS